MQSGSGYGMAPQYAYPGGMMMPAGAAGYGASAGGYGGPRQGGAGYPAGAGAYGGGAMAANPLSRSGSGVDATAYATAAYTGQQQDAAKQFSGRGGGARRGAQVQQQVQQQQQ